MIFQLTFENKEVFFLFLRILLLTLQLNFEIVIVIAIAIDLLHLQKLINYGIK